MKPFTTLAAAIFLLVATGHAIRLAMGWGIAVEGFAIPLWLSGVGTVVPAALAIMLLREARRS